MKILNVQRMGNGMEMPRVIRNRMANSRGMEMATQEVDNFPMERGEKIALIEICGRELDFLSRVSLVVDSARHRPYVIASTPHYGQTILTSNLECNSSVNKLSSDRWRWSSVFIIEASRLRKTMSHTTTTTSARLVAVNVIIFMEHFC